MNERNLMQYAFSKKNILSQKGFTLLEILVVVSIIGILIALGSAAFSNAQRKARDARRRSDMKAYQNVYEQYYAQSNGYGTCAAMNVGFTGGVSGAPSDPKPDEAYSIACDTDSYCACATLESDAGNGSGTAAGATCDFTGTTQYCVTNMQ